MYCRRCGEDRCTGECQEPIQPLSLEELHWFSVDEYLEEDHPGIVLPNHILLLHGSRHGKVLDRNDTSRYPEYEDRVLVFGKEKRSFFVGLAPYMSSGLVPFGTLVFESGFGRNRWKEKLVELPAQV